MLGRVLLAVIQAQLAEIKAKVFGCMCMCWSANMFLCAMFVDTRVCTYYEDGYAHVSLKCKYWSQCVCI